MGGFVAECAGFCLASPGAMTYNARVATVRKRERFSLKSSLSHSICRRGEDRSTGSMPLGMPGGLAYASRMCLVPAVVECR
jgi:hypothetical protein